MCWEVDIPASTISLLQSEVCTALKFSDRIVFPPDCLCFMPVLVLVNRGLAPFISSLSLSEGKVPDIELQQSSVCSATERLYYEFSW